MVYIGLVIVGALVRGAALVPAAARAASRAIVVQKTVAQGIVAHLDAQGNGPGKMMPCLIGDN